MLPLRRIAALVGTAAVGAVCAPGAATAAAPAAVDIVQPVTRSGATITMRLHRVPLRGPQFELKVQQRDGSYTSPATPIGERAYVGTVDERPGAVASAIVTSGGHVRGQIVFDRGATWFTEDATVADTRGLDDATVAWPTLPTLAGGRSEGHVRAWDVAVDTDSEYLAQRGRSVAQALDAIEYSMSNIRAIYLHDTGMMPRLARVVLRASQARDPYVVSDDTYLGLLRDHWRTEQADTVRDEVVLASVDGSGGGVAYRVDMSPANAYAYSGADDDGRFDVVARHALKPAQARRRTGILTLVYRGDGDTRPQTVRVRVGRRAR